MTEYGAPSHTMSEINTSDVYKLIVGNNISDAGTEEQMQLNNHKTQEVNVNNLGSTSSLPTKEDI